MPAPWRFVVADNLTPRRAVLDMAPYHPPTGGRRSKLRLDFNENTVGAPPHVIDFIKRFKIIGSTSNALSETRERPIG